MLQLPKEINVLITNRFSTKEILKLRLVNFYFESIFQAWLQYNEVRFNNKIINEILGMLRFFKV